MADENENDVLTDINSDAAMPNGEDTMPAAGIVSQYVKDMSVENPNAPASFQWQEQPEIELQFNIAAEPVNDDIHEVELKVNVAAKAKEGNVYLIELVYAGLIGMRNLPDDAAHAFLYAEAPRLLFPFARRVIADAVRDAGYPPLMLDPIDFNGIYLQQLQAQQAQGGADSQAAAPAAEN